MPLHELRRHIADRPLIGTTILSTAPSVVEIAAMSPFDVLCLDAEHSALSIEQIESLVRAADVHNKPTIVRVPEAGHYIGRVLDLGASGVVVPRLETAEEVADVVQRARFAPSGKRGAGPGRGSQYGYSLASSEYTARANASTLVIVQIENAAAVDAIDEIASVPDLDAVVIGPFDLALSMGVAPGGPEHTNAIEKVIEAATDRGIATGAFCFSERDVDFYTRRGSRVLLIGGDLPWISSGVAAEWDMWDRVKSATSATVA
ncbi:aldolase/citrate lyase family protein [Rhodococcus sp. 1R11]|uniref:HpcH/HpaI aldolase family protein n=1 Tax=Rhodococcus sp. 1R11 TaxID=2559614 RepID=UPI00246912C4|nr:aldolase/citrate lyase family protein [Rhodococcus sp. 1R11]